MTDISKITNEQVHWERMEQKRLNNTYPIDPDDIIPDLVFEQFNNPKTMFNAYEHTEWRFKNSICDINILNYRKDFYEVYFNFGETEEIKKDFKSLKIAKSWSTERYKKKVAEVLESQQA